MQADGHSSISKMCFMKASLAAAVPTTLSPFCRLAAYGGPDECTADISNDAIRTYDCIVIILHVIHHALFVWSEAWLETRLVAPSALTSMPTKCRHQSSEQKLSITMSEFHLHGFDSPNS